MACRKKITTEIYIDGMTCSHCAAAAEAALKNTDGIPSAKVDLENNNATFYVEDKLTLDLISREKNKVVLREFFDNLGLSYSFKVKEAVAKGNVNELSSYFGGKLEVDE